MQIALSLGLLVALGGQLMSSEPFIVDDLAVISNFETKAGVLAESGEAPDVKELKRTLKNPVGLNGPLTGEVVSRVEDGVYVIGAVYDCGKCDRWHPAGFASAWAIGSDGIFATNYHVISGMKGGLAAVSSADGSLYPILEVLLADEANDIAIVRADVTGIKVLPLAKEPAALGETVFSVSHPDRRFYTHTTGEVSRYYYHRKPRKDGVRVPFMAITTEYARGSSGAPILNENNEVVGMVSNTSNIYYGKKGQKGEGILQMVIKNCVPGFKVQELLDSASLVAEEEATPVETESVEVAPIEVEAELAEPVEAAAEAVAPH